MGTFETLAVVAAVYAVVFLAHQASKRVESDPDPFEDADVAPSPAGDPLEVG